MNTFRVLAAILIILLFVLGIGAIFYGLFLISTSLAFIALGIMLIGISILINQLIPSHKGGDKR